MSSHPQSSNPVDLYFTKNLDQFEGYHESMYVRGMYGCLGNFWKCILEAQTEQQQGLESRKKNPEIRQKNLPSGSNLRPFTVSLCLSKTDIQFITLTFFLDYVEE